MNIKGSYLGLVWACLSPDWWVGRFLFVCRDHCCIRWVGLVFVFQEELIRQQTFRADTTRGFLARKWLLQISLLFLSKGRTADASSLVYSNIFSVHHLPGGLYSFLTCALLTFSIFCSLIIILCLTQARHMHFNYLQCKSSLKGNPGMYCIFN